MDSDSGEEFNMTASDISDNFSDDFVSAKVCYVLPPPRRDASKLNFHLVGREIERENKI